MIHFYFMKFSFGCLHLISSISFDKKKCIDLRTESSPYTLIILPFLRYFYIFEGIKSAKLVFFIVSILNFLYSSFSSGITSSSLFYTSFNVSTSNDSIILLCSLSLNNSNTLFAWCNNFFCLFGSHVSTIFSTT